MDEDVLIPAFFFITVITLAIGVPLVRAYVRRMERGALLPPSDPQVHDRLAHIEQAIDAMAVEVERISEGQRFVTRVLADRPAERAAIPNQTGDRT
ncbi:MAG: hypothetical protein ACT4P7_23005 [Gemmatimonadaceae bacterium]